ncbi:3-hydroxybutyrate oligomer hydrolase family protein [Beijerinckia indica]|uniref:Putative D--3-hydroxybutyrate oligomer hydrolase lipoprotein transmembrane n=1 Tax=Beijerinckia indica subsp. indica (strain ATCC 9039 / DSM 1715 / NCIMB 8712) TaxID=395963 RepID=B2IFK3_BEII9|nr:3-hydroxybutyrate oligomer hydrolase family protein [Beijerinckia indica]ACB97099.1 putative D--3-hydroxybutyrate oligomer hydrolase lipoprotein transmembrane [Beijerinckia indica subsp. indica ATCC 9039]
MNRNAWITATFSMSASLATLLVSTVMVEAWTDEEPVFQTHYDGVTNDLLTAGLGKSGLGSTTPPAFTDPLHPMPEELRRLAIYSNYRALIDPTPGGGYGSLYGPNVTADGTVTNGEGLIAGDEYITFDRGDDGHGHVTMMVQVPDSYDPAKGCIITAPSSGSRGVYGAIATAGEWGLKHGCAVAYTDKGSGTGAHDLQNNTVNLIRGERQDAAVAGDDSNFTATLTRRERAAFNAAYPNRFAFKHAHSQKNPEKDWGRNVLQSIKFAFSVLNKKFGQRGAEISKRNTLVIASSVSNGGGASVRAVEQDDEHLIDGLAVGEPNVNPEFSSKFSIVQSGRPPLQAHSRPLIDYITLVNVFQGCANLAAANAAAPLNAAPSTQRCADLHTKGLLAGSTLADQANEAQKIINDFGILPEQNLVQPGYWFAFVPQSISVTYANAYGRFSVADHLCNYSFGASASGVPGSLAPSAEAAIFGTSNGIPPTAGINLINDAAPDGPREDRVSTPAQNLDGALCLRSLATGKDAASGTKLFGPQSVGAHRINEGVEQIIASGNLHRTPAVFVTGRSDGILPPNFASRAYFGLNNVVEGSISPLHYYEVTNAHHLDSFNQFAGYNAMFIPLHRYFIQAMDLMYDHLLHGKALPPSQVVHTIPRGDGAPSITLANVPPIVDTPPASALITFSAGEVNIPN